MRKYWFINNITGELYKARSIWAAYWYFSNDATKYNYQFCMDNVEKWNGK